MENHYEIGVVYGGVILGKCITDKMGEEPVCAYPVHGEWAYDEYGQEVDIGFLCKSCKATVRKRTAARRSKEKVVKRMNNLRQENASLTATDEALARVSLGHLVKKWEIKKAIDEKIRLSNELREKINQFTSIP